MGRQTNLFAASFLLAALAANGPARAQSPAEAPKLPGGSIFGFSDPTDLGSPGDHGAAVEADSSIGKRQGRYRSFNQKWSYERTVAEGWLVGAAFFTAYHSVRNSPATNRDRSMAQFDGAAFVVARSIFERSAGQPFGMTIALEPRWARLDDFGRRSESFGGELKFLFDAVVVPDKLFWAGNLVLGYDNSRDPDIRSKWAKASGVKLSQALALQLHESFFVGVEATYAASFSGAAFDRFDGHAVFLGPTAFWKISEKASLNATIAPQIAGRNVATPGQKLDLDGFTRAIARVKLAVEF